ncbi:MAG: hypothetical protein ACTSUI_06115 [Promethearchaeota archaeon]
MQGVENVVLTQRDGNPIQYSGVWLSKNEIFSVSAATSAIFNCGISLYEENMKYILIEGKKAKILISPLKNYGNTTINKIISAQNLQGNDNEFFVAITTSPRINLAGIFLKTRKNLAEIKKSLILSGESFKPPLRHFIQQDIDDMINKSNVKEEIDFHEDVSLFSLNISPECYIRLKNILEKFSENTPGMINSYIVYNGGFLIADLEMPNVENSELSLETEASMSYSLFSTANKCAWLLKKMQIQSLLVECTDSYQFIFRIENGVFSTKIRKGSQKLGLLRLMVPRYCSKISIIMKQNIQNPTPLDFSNIFSEITL